MELGEMGHTGVGWALNLTGVLIEEEERHTGKRMPSSLRHMRGERHVTVEAEVVEVL